MQIELNYENVSKLRDILAIYIASFTTLELLLYFFNRGLYHYWEILYRWIPWALRQVYIFQILTFFFVLHFGLLCYKPLQSLVIRRLESKRR